MNFPCKLNLNIISDIKRRFKVFLFFEFFQQTQPFRNYSLQARMLNSNKATTLWFYGLFHILEDVVPKKLSLRKNTKKKIVLKFHSLSNF